MRTRALLMCVMAVPLVAWSQASNTVVGAGYLSPVHVDAAPGQLITLFVEGVGSRLTAPVWAGAGKLPTTLAGIAVTFTQGVAVAAPILEVAPISACSSPAPLAGCGTLTAVTIQVPYEAVPPCLPLTPTGVCPLVVLPPARIVVSENGVAGAVTELNLYQDQIHVLNTCDIMAGGVGYGPFTGLRCQPIVTHMDGSLVTAASPAQPREKVAAFAVGLGETNPPAVTGQPVQVRVPSNESIVIGFDFTPNALPSRTQGSIASSLFAGLIPGYPGFYEIDFVVPSLAEPVAPSFACAAPGTFVPGENVVQSNLTVNFMSAYSFDGAAICVSNNI